ncbi:phage antirepressor KilAC domain-containing protein [Runella sp.]|uniref:phage antirepressor KilAC domain-containing protein n=1 Tax=Runella sp. TaxID=1960881 RepID=UPI003D0D1A08
MQALITITTNGQGSEVVSARDLYEYFALAERFSKWIDRMFEYGFNEGIDYTPYQKVHPLNNQFITDYYLTLDTAKEIAMLQRSDKGKEIRQYFIQYEKRSKELIQQLTRPQSDVEILSNAVLVANRLLAEKEEQIKALVPKAEYVDKVLASDTAITTTVIANELGMTAQMLNTKLCHAGVQYKSGKNYILYAKYQHRGFAMTKTHQYTDKEGKSHTKHYLVWTEIGRKYIHYLYSQDLSWSKPNKQTA